MAHKVRYLDAPPIQGFNPLVIDNLCSIFPSSLTESPRFFNWETKVRTLLREQKDCTTSASNFWFDPTKPCVVDQETCMRVSDFGV